MRRFWTKPKALTAVCIPCFAHFMHFLSLLFLFSVSFYCFLNFGLCDAALDNFNTLAVCKRIGFCRAMDQPFDGPLFQAVANQARALNQKMAETKNAAAAVAAVVRFGAEGRMD
jgi:hypothetical protein